MSEFLRSNSSSGQADETPFDILKEESTADTAENQPDVVEAVEEALDTGESAEKQEKLEKGIKIAIGGPPHSGKSVFIEALTQNLDKNSTVTQMGHFCFWWGRIVQALIIYKEKARFIVII